MAAMVTHRGVPNGQGARVGISLSGTSLSAVFVPAGEARARAWHTTLSAMAPDAAPLWPEFVEALRALSTAAGIQHGRLLIALMPSLAEVRCVQVPPIDDEALRQLLARNAGKYFLTARGPQIVGTVPRGVCAATRVAAAASTRLLTVIHASAEAADWMIEAIHPAEASWAAAALEWAEGSEKGNVSATQLLITRAEHIELLQIERGQLSVVRRFRAGTLDIERIVEASRASGGEVLLAGTPTARTALSTALAGHGVNARTPTGTSTELVDDADALAAAYAGRALAPTLTTEAVRAERSHRARRLTVRLAVAAGAMLLLAGALQLWDVRRELAVVRAERESLRPQLSATLVGRTTVETAFRQLAVLAAADRGAPQWSAVIAGISSELPLESYLTGFRGRADTVGVDGLALYAARVFDAVEQVPLLRDVRASAPVRRETSAEGEALERFQLTALLKRTIADSTQGGGR